MRSLQELVVDVSDQRVDVERIPNRIPNGVLPRLELATVYEVVVGLLLEVATYGSKGFLHGDVGILRELLRAAKAAVIVVVSSSGVT